MIVSPNGNIVAIAQVSLDSVNQYFHTLTAGGMMSNGGEYIVKANYGAQKGETTFNYTGNIR